MGIAQILGGYQERIVTLHAAASQLRVGQVAALAIMSVAIVAILVLAFFSVARRSVPLSCCLLPVPIAVYSGLAGKRRNAALLQTLRLESYYHRGIDRVEGRWAGSGVRGDEFARPGHSFEKDLHLFGQGSLFELLCTVTTDVGRRRLADTLLEPPTLNDVLDRQPAVRELQDKLELLDRIHTLGTFSFEDSRSSALTEWLEGPLVTACAFTRRLALGTSTCLAILVLLGFDSVLAWSTLVFWIGGVLALHGVFGMIYRKQLLASMPTIRPVKMEIGVLRQGLGLLQVEEFDCALLRRLAASSRRGDPQVCLRQLERLMGALIERDKEWFYGISPACLIGTQLFWAIGKWKQKHANALRDWLGAWGELEALIALATYAYEHPGNSFPRLSADQTMFEAKSIAHPLLPAAKCVRNDVSLNEKTRFYVISGSNIAGKSTLLRALGLNAVLAYAGAPVCVEEMTLSMFSLCASISIEDSLLLGKSKFLAEMDRLKAGLNMNGNVLFLIDEILGGTNSRDRRIAAEAIVRALVERGAVGAFTTHDLALSELAELPGLDGTNVHMGSRNGSDPMDFDYLLKPGVIKESSALAIARLAGISV